VISLYSPTRGKIFQLFSYIRLSFYEAVIFCVAEGEERFNND
jgi:hypothetical protein